MSQHERVLSDADVEAVAAALAPKVVELLRGTPAVAPVDAVPGLWSTAQVGDFLGRSAEWVRDHRDELGVITTGGVRPRLMFDPGAVRSWATAREGVVRSETRDPASPLGAKRKRSQRMGTGADLLPIRGEQAA